MYTENINLSGITKSERLTIVAVEDRIRAASSIMQRILSQLKEEYGSRADFLKIDSHDLLKQSGESSYYGPPVCLFVKNGEVIELFRGLVSKTRIDECIQKHLPRE